ncbi:Cuticular protein [Nesidiocoris tenuis]|uniref:Cuticular protein n=1 Tax=Nesidiocoris tenuis TaxID=355587 RepID=A0ABN7ALG2_9HEMI|nr:Cuticular protein [Nesidiocoris tenuis]
MKTLVFAFCVGAAFAFPQQYNQQQYKPNQQQPFNQGNRQAPSQPQPQQQQPLKPTSPPVPILSLDNTVNHDGSYKYSFEGGDGTRAEQTGQLKSIGQDAGEVSQGSYSYVGDDGKTYSLTYTADETGYHPAGDHLPQPPPIPEAILRSLEYLATAPPFKDELASELQNKNGRN